ncbi:AcvB/VirJ family lysyl-phosphatidylglycerol hydrolase [Mesorhizobium sp. ORM6]
MTLSASSPGSTSRTPWPTASRFTQDDERHGGKKSPPNGANVGRLSKAEIGPANLPRPNWPPPPLPRRGVVELTAHHTARKNARRRGPKPNLTYATWLGVGGDHPVAPAIAIIPRGRVLCVYGENKEDTACTDPLLAGIRAPQD